MPRYDQYSPEAVDRRLYKYFDPTGALATLRGGTLRWSQPGRFNDPFDMQFDLSLSFNNDDLRHEVARRLFDFYTGATAYGPGRNLLADAIEILRAGRPGMNRETFEREVMPGIDRSIASMPTSIARMNAEVREELASCKVLCLTDRYNSILMWSHYASNHTGAVFKFRNIPELDSPYVTARPVSYQEAIPALATFDEFAGIFSGNWTFAGRGISNTFMYTKSIDWSYEHEYRIVSGQGRDRNSSFEDLPFGPAELESVYFGVRAGADFIRDTTEALNEIYPHALRFQGTRASDSFAINFAQV